MTRVIAPRHYTLAQRIALHVAINEDGCWIWTGAVDKGNGYGRMRFAGTTWTAHRASYTTHVGPVPEGYQLDHLCRVRACCNPQHLEPVTPLVNSRRSPLHNGQKTHCPQGHAYDEANTQVNNGRRTCRACKDAHNLSRSRKKQVA